MGVTADNIVRYKVSPLTEIRHSLIDLWQIVKSNVVLISLHIHSMWETTVMHKQVSGCTVNFGPNFPEYPFLESQTRIPPPPPFRKTSDLGWPKFTPEYPPILENFRFRMTKVYSGIPPPHFGKLQIWDDQSILWNTPPFGKLQIWDDQSLLWNTPPPPISENFRFGMTKVYSGIPLPHFGKLQIWDDQSLLWNTPSPHFGKLQIWDDPSLPPPPPFRKTSDLGWPKFTPEYPPPPPPRV